MVRTMWRWILQRFRRGTLKGHDNLVARYHGELRSCSCSVGSVAPAGITQILDLDIAMDVAWCGHLAEWGWTHREVSVLRGFSNLWCSQYHIGNVQQLAHRIGQETLDIPSHT